MQNKSYIAKIPGDGGALGALYTEWVGVIITIHTRAVGSGSSPNLPGPRIWESGEYSRLQVYFARNGVRKRIGALVLLLRFVFYFWNLAPI